MKMQRIMGCLLCRRGRKAMQFQATSLQRSQLLGAATRPVREGNYSYWVLCCYMPGHGQGMLCVLVNHQTMVWSSDDYPHHSNEDSKPILHWLAQGHKVNVWQTALTFFSVAPTINTRPLGGSVPHCSSCDGQNFDHIKGIHILLGATWEYATLHGKRKAK